MLTISSMAASKESQRLLNGILLVIYLLVLSYFLLFAEGLGRTNTSEEYRYSLTLFQEINRFYSIRDTYPKAFLLNVVGNVVVFAPLGYFLPGSLRACRNGFLTVFLSFLLSLMMESLQLFSRLGCFDVDDLFLNTLGGLCGYLIFVLLDKGRKHRESKKKKKL